jgi:SAM-dependent methyltransferase
VIKIEWIEDATCVVCGEQSTQPVYAKATPYPLPESSKEPLFWQLIYHECPECGLRFMNPRPDPDSYSRYYGSMAYREACFASIPEMDADEQLRADIYEPNLPENIKYHLDVGCSRGYLLKKSRAKDAKVLGVEPHEGYTDPSIPTVRDINDIEGQFDLVTCIHVLEHTNDPPVMAKRLIELTEPGGILIVEVPCETPPGKSAGFSHPFAFQPHTIKRLFGDLELVKYTEPEHQIFIMRKPNKER